MLSRVPNDVVEKLHRTLPIDAEVNYNSDKQGKANAKRYPLKPVKGVILVLLFLFLILIFTRLLFTEQLVGVLHLFWRRFHFIII
jgi:hypothetical protein